MVPQPVKAVLILFPITPATEEAKDKEEAKLKQSGQDVSSKVWFSKQTVSNACGTVAMLHAFANADVKYKAGSFLEKFMKASLEMDALQRAKLLENPSEGQPDVEKVHQEAGKEGQTAPPPEEEQVRVCSRSSAGFSTRRRRATLQITLCCVVECADHEVHSFQRAVHMHRYKHLILCVLLSVNGPPASANGCECHLTCTPFVRIAYTCTTTASLCNNLHAYCVFGVASKPVSSTSTKHKLSGTKQTVRSTRAVFLVAGVAALCVLL